MVTYFGELRLEESHTWEQDNLWSPKMRSKNPAIAWGQRKNQTTTWSLKQAQRSRQMKKYMSIALQGALRSFKEGEPSCARMKAKKKDDDRLLWKEGWSVVAYPKFDAKPSKTKPDAEPSSITVFLILAQPNWWSPKPSAGTQRNLKSFDCRCTRCGNRHT